MLTLAIPALAASPEEAVDQALNWLQGQQNADGGFSNGFSPESGVPVTAEVVIALAAGGRDAGSVRSAEGASPLDFLYQQVQAGQVDGVGTTAKIVLALVAAGLDPADFGGWDLIGQMEGAYDPDSGSYCGSIFDQALVVLALANAGRTVPQGAVDYLLAFQTTDGAWSFMGDTAALSGDTNTTALAIQALAAAGRKDDTGRGLAYLQRVQNADGGWPYQNPSPYGTETDANSTALVLQAIYAAGQTPADWYVEGADPLGTLLSLQNASGSFSFQASFPGDNVLATIQAVPSAAGVTLAAVRRAPTSAAPGEAGGTPPTTLPEAGGFAAPAAGGMLILGLFLVALGQWLKRTRQPADR
jgi:prenyltransferase beta subunit